MCVYVCVMNELSFTFRIADEAKNATINKSGTDMNNLCTSLVNTNEAIRGKIVWKFSVGILHYSLECHSNDRPIYHIHACIHTCIYLQLTYVMPESHERILRRIIRRFGSFPTRTYSNRISNDANGRITYGERSGRVLNLNKTCA